MEIWNSKGFIMKCNHLCYCIYFSFEYKQTNKKNPYTHILFFLNAKYQILTFLSEVWVFAIYACASVGTTVPPICHHGVNICWLSKVDNENSSVLGFVYSKRITLDLFQKQFDSLFGCQVEWGRHPLLSCSKESVDKWNELSYNEISVHWGPQNGWTYGVIGF